MRQKRLDPGTHGDSVAGIQTRISTASKDGWHVPYDPFGLLLSGSLDRPKELQRTSHLT